MVRELLLTTLATTISIVLTFGTAALLERKQQEKNRRQITLMVISDIYDFARVMERTDTALLVPWKESLLEMKAMPRDSIIMLDDEEVLQGYWNALGQGAMLPRDHTAQNLFSSDISIWRDVDNSTTIPDGSSLAFTPTMRGRRRRSRAGRISFA